MIRLWNPPPGAPESAIIRVWNLNETGDPTGVGYISNIRLANTRVFVLLNLKTELSRNMITCLSIIQKSKSLRPLTQWALTFRTPPKVLQIPWKLTELGHLGLDGRGGLVLSWTTGIEFEDPVVYFFQENSTNIIKVKFLRFSHDSFF